MIITRTPYRISFAGGGSDLPDYFKKHGGAVISTTIDKYIYISLHDNFDLDHILLKYSRTEKVIRPEQIKNTVARSILSEFKARGISLETVGDVPAKTGLGSSSSFAVGLHHIMNSYSGKTLSKESLAQHACRTEIDDLKSPIGKQDQYAAAYGGFNFYKFLPNGKVSVERIIMAPQKKSNLENNLIIFYTGKVRSSNTILKKQIDNLKNDPQIVERTKNMVAIAYAMRESLEKGDLNQFGRLLHKGWEQKKSLNGSISSRTIDRYYRIALDHGALGGKILGAGGGGFLLFYCEKKHQPRLRLALRELRELPFAFAAGGSEIIFQS